MSTSPSNSSTTVDPSGSHNNNGDDDDDETIQALVHQLTLEEQIRLLSGKSMWALHGILEDDEQQNQSLPSIRLSDGPQGVRKTVTEITALEAYEATCFPTACALACSWNRALVNRVGQALSAECQDQQVSVLLGPGANLVRYYYLYCIP